MILALPLIGLALANAFNLASVDGKQKMLLVASICIIGFSLPIGLGSLHPNSIEHEAVQDLVNLGVDENKVLLMIGVMATWFTIMVAKLIKGLVLIDNLMLTILLKMF